MSRELLDVLDPAIQFRLMIAAHELGHALSWAEAGLDVAGIELSGRGFNTEGQASLRKGIRLPTEEQRCGYLVGLLAGTEAGIRWCQQTGASLSDHAVGCRWDLRAFHRNHHHLGQGHIPEREFRAQARTQITALWPRLAPLAHRLAAHGALAL